MINMDNNVVKQAYIDENGQYIIILMDNTKIIVTQDELLNAYLFELDDTPKNSINLIKHYEFDKHNNQAITVSDGRKITITSDSIIDWYIKKIWEDK